MSNQIPIFKDKEAVAGPASQLFSKRTAAKQSRRQVSVPLVATASVLLLKKRISPKSSRRRQLVVHLEISEFSRSHLCQLHHLLKTSPCLLDQDYNRKHQPVHSEDTASQSSKISSHSLE